VSMSDMGKVNVCSWEAGQGQRRLGTSSQQEKGPFRFVLIDFECLIMITSTKLDVCDGEVCHTSLLAGQDVRPEDARHNGTVTMSERVNN